MINKYKIGDINIIIEGENCLAKELRRYFQYCEDNSWNGEADLRIKVSNVDVLKEQSYFSLSGKFGFSQNEFQKKDDQINYKIENLFTEGKQTVLNIFVKGKDSIHSKISRSLTGCQIGMESFEEERVNSLMNYSFFWYIFPVVLLKSKMAFIHSSINVYKNKGIIVTGTGGCGKTSFNFRLLDEPGCKFVNEDFGIVNSEGKAFYNPKYVTIYQSDISHGQKDLVNFKRNLKGKHKLHWMLSDIRIGNPRTRISAVDLLGKERIAKECKIENVFYFARSNEKEVKITEISVQEMAKRTARASFRELSYLYELIMNAEAVCHKEIEIPTMEELLKKQEENLEMVFSHTNNYLVVVPLKAGPEEIFEKLRGIIE